MLSKTGERDLAWNWNDAISLLKAYLFSVFWGVIKLIYWGEKGIIVQKVVQLFKSHYDKKSLTEQSFCEVSLYLERGNGIVLIGFLFIIVTL